MLLDKLLCWNDNWFHIIFVGDICVFIGSSNLAAHQVSEIGFLTWSLSMLFGYLFGSKAAWRNWHIFLINFIIRIINSALLKWLNRLPVIIIDYSWKKRKRREASLKSLSTSIKGSPTIRSSGCSMFSFLSSPILSKLSLSMWSEVQSARSKMLLLRAQQGRARQYVFW